MQLWETDYYAEILDLRQENRQLRELLERVLNEGHKSYRIKSVLSSSSDLVSHWCISEELKKEIEECFTSV